MYIKNQDARVKALKAAMVADKEYRGEYNIVGVVSPKRDGYVSTDMLRDAFDRWGDAHGATKACHLYNKLDNDKEFKYIIVKRMKAFAHPACGNQLELEIKCYNKFAGTPEQDYISPILRYELHRGDKLHTMDNRYQNHSMIVAQRAIEVCDVWTACIKAEQMNDRDGLYYPYEENASKRTEMLLDFADRQGWFDIENGNEGNCGVIFDYAAGRYKAVIIDYAL